MVKANANGPMGANSQALLSIMKSKVMACMYGMMAVNIKASGIGAKCMDMVPSCGLMEDNI